jgi:hypothetical protein
MYIKNKLSAIMFIYILSKVKSISLYIIKILITLIYLFDIKN